MTVEVPLFAVFDVFFYVVLGFWGGYYADLVVMFVSLDLV